MYKRKPEWLKIKIESNDNLKKINELKKHLKLNTVCDEASCPNRSICHNKGTATFMILGSVCTRNCRFCNVTSGKPQELNIDEPKNVAEAIKSLNLKHAVITSVTRDDLKDGGAEHFKNVIKEIRNLNPSTTVEVLIPDLKGCKDSLKLIVDEKPDVLNHNVETVKRLYNTVRPAAIYERSLNLLKNVKEMDPNILTKSGFMVGLGETFDEVVELMEDLRKVNCDILTIGQYLAPSKKHIEVSEYVHPDTFLKYKNIGLKMGFKYVASAPLVRSSYDAAKALE